MIDAKGAVVKADGSSAGAMASFLYQVNLAFQTAG